MIRILCFLLLTMSGANALATSHPERWNFKVYLDDKPVGVHTFSIDGPSRDRRLKSDARFDVDFFIFNAYSYRHESRERWHGDCLAEIKASTDDNGDRISVRGASEKESFVIFSNQGQDSLPGCVMTFAYWNPAMLGQKRLLNPQTGEYLDVDIQEIGKETIKVGGKEAPASRYRLKAEKFLIDLWYSPDRRWLALDSTLSNGQVLHYRIE